MINYLRELLHQPYFGALMAMLVCLCFYLLTKSKTNKRNVWIIYSVLCTAAFLIFCGSIFLRLKQDQVYDFTAFYLYAKVAVSGHDYYSPEHFHTVFSTLSLPALDYSGFIEEIVNVGFLYPPPTILLFTPLGFLSYHTALIAWSIFNLFIALGCIYLAYNLFLKKYKLKGLMLVAALFFLFSPVRETFYFSQTNFVLLFLLLLMYKYRDKKFAGILLPLALFTKPYMIVFGLIFILKKQWKTVIYFIAGSIVITGITFLLFGKEPFLSYIFNNPSKRLPVWVFSEGINQSLHAVLLRLNFITVGKPLPYTLISLGIILVTGFYLFYLLKHKLYNYVWMVLLLVALLIYPGTLSYYAVLLLFIVFQFFDEQKAPGVNRYVNILIIGILYYLCSVSVFTCLCFLLFFIVYKSLTHLSRNTDSSISVEPA
jgi:hypothetical protein